MRKIILYDINPELCKAWEEVFEGNESIEVRNCAFADLECENIVTAGNSFGWMTGGIDLAVRNYYGVDIQDYIQHEIILAHRGQLPVGESLLILTPDKQKPSIIYAPTMTMPGQINPSDILFIFLKLLEKYDSFACCGLGTLTGGVPVIDCAKAMLKAWEFHYNY